jgi:hypothetical protein
VVCNICTAHFVQIPDFSYGVVNQFLHTMLRELSYHHGRHGFYAGDGDVVWHVAAWCPTFPTFLCVFLLVQLLEGITYA